MVNWSSAALHAGVTPVFYAYSLGKAQEAMAIIGGAGLPLTVHNAVAGMAVATPTVVEGRRPRAIDERDPLGEPIV